MTSRVDPPEGCDCDGDGEDDTSVSEEEIYDYEVIVDKQKYPESAQHIDEAQAEGHPTILTIDRGGAKANRRESLRGIPTQPSKDRDEYPPAMFAEGGSGASVKHITEGDNRGSGATFGRELKDYDDGAKIKFSTSDDD